MGGPLEEREAVEGAVLNDLDAKLGRIAARVAVRADETRAELDRLGWLESITLCRDTFGARLVHLKTEKYNVGQDVQSVPYDFNLRANPGTKVGRSKRKGER